LNNVNVLRISLRSTQMQLNVESKLLDPTLYTVVTEFFSMFL